MTLRALPRKQRNSQHLCYDFPYVNKTGHVPHAWVRSNAFHTSLRRWNQTHFPPAGLGIESELMSKFLHGIGRGRFWAGKRKGTLLLSFHPVCSSLHHIGDTYHIIIINLHGFISLAGGSQNKIQVQYAATWNIEDIVYSIYSYDNVYI